MHLERAQSLIRKLAVKGMPKWEKLTPERQRVIDERMKRQGISDPREFWNYCESVFLPFKSEAMKDWSYKGLDLLLRVPERGTPDHFLRAEEGAYRDEGAAYRQREDQRVRRKEQERREPPAPPEVAKDYIRQIKERLGRTYVSQKDGARHSSGNGEQDRVSRAEVSVDGSGKVFRRVKGTSDSVAGGGGAPDKGKRVPYLPPRPVGRVHRRKEQG